MEFWSRLMPEDEEIRGALYLAKVSSVRTKGELEELVRELCKELGIIGNSPREGTLEEPVYKEALTCAWQRFGYPKALAEGRTRILCSEEEGEMEYLAEEIRSFLVHKEWQGEVYKLLGDIRKKQGRTREAFENYFLALDHEPHPYIKMSFPGSSWRIFTMEAGVPDFSQRRQT